MVKSNNICLDRETKQVHLLESFPEDDNLLETLFNKASAKGYEDIMIGYPVIDSSSPKGRFVFVTMDWFDR
jgi:hypothetical protein